uniref:SLC41A/MgtE integral membrane domain-containing protein n=1 Tax=Eutreptiella gymnastica TaxID=73025 RepID=A0A7S4GEZ9_9EUGL|eukprot:CAMPEP_0174332282 /NCGR_PEP_ID=MMETSP0810-20121108/18176_1 /TAXON_ID=73025 ORGANISM="Eutreptiella gymnastica-like, Strain CCMP1594" /NCGR_SAMPLE_ID=MMETSP0810 /ASSEMBLY_ACC=CAM_ASM_000659 /LENGTH=430 /DNA_ID=CAMNT_0015448603 /DNA_START=17 /DNA_END=1309 /DNA_ORIENTATION=+
MPTSRQSITSSRRPLRQASGSVQEAWERPMREVVREVHLWWPVPMAHFDNAHFTAQMASVMDGGAATLVSAMASEQYPGMTKLAVLIRAHSNQTCAYYEQKLKTLARHETKAMAKQEALKSPSHVKIAAFAETPIPSSARNPAPSPTALGLVQSAHPGAGSSARRVLDAPSLDWRTVGLGMLVGAGLSGFGLAGYHAAARCCCGKWRGMHMVGLHIGCWPLSWCCGLQSDKQVHHQAPNSPYNQAAWVLPETLVVWSRSWVLVCLLAFQSLSSSVLQHYEDLLSEHAVVVMFLTMLIGAGGNYGMQATLRVISGLETNTLSLASICQVFGEELMIAILSSTLVTAAGFLRIYIFVSGAEASFALDVVYSLTLSLFCVVLVSGVIGTLLPFGLRVLGLSPQHAAPCIQVLMDVIGITVTCWVNKLMLSPLD